jgi:cation diffusion facilitator family transporter
MINKLKNIETKIKKVTLTAIILNILLAIIKLLLGYLGNSQVLIADGVHSFSDLTTDLSIIFGVKYWLAPADKEHQYGHLKMENLISVFIAIMIACAGIAVLIKAVFSLRNNSVQQTSFIAFVAAFISIVLKEWLYRYTLKQADKLKSSALKANAWHHRTDAISSIPVAIVIVISSIFPGLFFLDYFGAIIVSVFIIYPAYKIFCEAVSNILDKGVDQKTLSDIENMVLQTKEVKEVHEIRTRKIGEVFFVDMHILVDGNISVCQGHNICENVKQTLMETNEDILDVLIHLEPFNETESKKNK